MSVIQRATMPDARRLPARVGAFGALLFLLLALSPAAQAERRSLSSIVDTADAGAPGLALTLLEQHQPSARSAPSSWQRWERARIHILVSERAWERALTRLTDLPAAAPREHRHWALERQAEVHLRRGDAASALAALRRLLWQPGTGADDERAKWRQWVVRAYLAGGRIEDAVTAMRRFDQDYPTAGDDADWQLLRGRVLIRGERIDEALAVLPSEARGEGLGLRLLAELRAGERSPEAIITRAQQALEGEDSPARADRARLHAVIKQASERQRAHARAALAAERAFALGDALPSEDSLFRVDADALWSAWLTAGQDAGNERQLLLGDDASWLAEVDAALPRYRGRAHALLAVVALRGSDAREQAHAGLVDELIEDGPGAGMVRRLYVDSERFSDVADIPTSVRHRLVEEALSRDDLPVAREFMRDLADAPEGRDPFDWRLLRARVLVLSGEPRAGADRIEELLATESTLSSRQLDRVLQVLFDLQGAREHERALALLERIGDFEMSGQRRRELFYWQAESHQSLDNHRRAAELYMRSATLLDGTGGDRWGQTARYQAAGALARIGLVNDARRIYRVLLNASEDAGRQAQLRNRLQQLGLRDPGPDDVPLVDDE